MIRILHHQFLKKQIIIQNVRILTMFAKDGSKGNFLRLTETIKTNKEANRYHFSKKSSKNYSSKRKIYPPRQQKFKDSVDYLDVPDQFKQNIVQSRNMQTPAQANIDQKHLKQIIVEQRQSLLSSLSSQINPQPMAQYLSQVPDYQKYYLRKPLNYLAKIFRNLALINVIGIAAFWYFRQFVKMGWWVGCVCGPSALLSVGLLLGCNISFWILKHGLQMHIPIQKIEETQLTLTSATWANLLQIGFLSAQFAGLIAALCFEYKFSLDQWILGLGMIGFSHLTFNIRTVFSKNKLSSRIYFGVNFQIAFWSFLLSMIYFIFYQMIELLQNPIDSDLFKAYRKQIKQVKDGHEQYKSFFKHQKFQVVAGKNINDDL